MFRGIYDALDTLLTIQKAVEATRGSDYFGLGTTSRGSFPSINLFQKGDDVILPAEIQCTSRGKEKSEVWSKYQITFTSWIRWG